MKITILGCGSASGSPSISHGWGACDPNNPRNRRRRPSILVEKGGDRVLVDTGPDCRQQLLDAQVRSLSAVLYTHDHADHLHGIDDLREVNRAMRKPLPIWADPETLKSIQSRFPYVLGVVGESQSIYKPMLLPNTMTGPFNVGTLAVVPFEQDHGYGHSMGFRFEKVAYSTDVVNLSEQAFQVLQGIEIWIVGCLTYEPHPTHAHLDKVLEWAERVRPQRVYLTHMTVTLDYETLIKRLPPQIIPAYDGLVIETE